MQDGSPQGFFTLPIVLNRQLIRRRHESFKCTKWTLDNFKILKGARIKAIVERGTARLILKAINDSLKCDNASRKVSLR